MGKWTICMAMGLLISASAAAQEALDAGQLAAAVEAVAPSLVQVEFTLQYDKGETPVEEQLVEDERPLEIAGALLAPTQAICQDPVIHPRFVKGIAVRFGDQLVDARVSAYMKDQNAVMLELAQPLKDAKPLVFDVEAKPPYLAVTYARVNGDWTVSVQTFGARVSETRAGRKFVSQPSYCLIVDKAGAPVGMTCGNELPLDSSWKGAPSKWPMISDEEMTQQLADLERTVNQGVLRVTLKFRSPKGKGGSRYFRSYGEAEENPVHHVNGVLADERTIIVLDKLKPKVTARLEQIEVHPPQGDAVPARFACTLSDYGCFVATLDTPLKGAIMFSKDDVLGLATRLLPSAQVIVQGENRVAYFWHSRISQIEVGWRQQLYPGISGSESNLFVFDSGGALVALPVSRRERVPIQSDWRSSEVSLTPVAYIGSVLADLPKHADANNVPLTEEQENRLARLGVELQPLDTELARANGVSHLTKDGETGALISYVYPGSPEAKAGIVQGDILLRLFIEGAPKPVEVIVRDESGFGGSFPWEMYDQVPEQYFDEIPHPWPPVENSLTRALTDAGFGGKYTAEIFHDGKVVTKEFTIVEGPPHYDSAPRYKSTPLGLTVRDLTYEVRRYFQKNADDPGVIVGKIETGSKASVAGIKPYEIITQVNGQPVNNVKDFERLAQDQTELRLSVERMSKGRTVQIKMTPAGPDAEKKVPPGLP